MTISTEDLGGVDIDLSSAARLERGLEALKGGDVPAALGSLAAIPETDWRAIMRRFPKLAVYLEQEMNT